MEPDGRAAPCLSFKLIGMDSAAGQSSPAAAIPQTSSVSRLGRLHSDSASSGSPRPLLSAESFLPLIPSPGDLALTGGPPQPPQPNESSCPTVLPIIGSRGLRPLMEFEALSVGYTDYDSSAPLPPPRTTLLQAGHGAADSPDLQQQMGFIRGLSILSEMPVIVTLLDLQAGHAVFQNDRSLRWGA